jgi:integrase
MASVREVTWTKANGDTATAWQLDYRDQHGKRRHKNFPKRKDADAWWTRHGAISVHDGTHVSDSETVTVSEAGEAWIRQGELGDGEHDPLERSTTRQYREHLRIHIAPHLGRIKLNKLTQAHVKKWQLDLREDEVSTAMVRKVTTSLNSILSAARILHQVERNVVQELRDQERGKKKSSTRHERKVEAGIDFPTKDEIRAILDAAQGNRRAITVTAIFTGLRSSELRGLRWADVDLDEGVLHVRQRADRFNVIGSPKSKSGQREVPLAPMVTNTLSAWKKTCPKGELDLVFPNGSGNVENHANLYRRTFGVVQEAAGLTTNAKKPKYGPKAFRHAAASLFIEQNMSPKKVQELMGHSSIKVTYDIYGHLFPSKEGDREAMAEIQARLIS